MSTIFLAKAPNLEGATSAWTTDNTGAVLVACGNGHLAGIPDHEVAPDGTITPSLSCPEEGCNWHVHARLEGYEEAS